MHDKRRDHVGSAPDRDADGYYTDMAGHLWKDNRGPDSHCARSGCGLVYARWSGDPCRAAPRCQATYNGIQCEREDGHDDDEHYSMVAWRSERGG
jgi:hypothetical protein